MTSKAYENQKRVLNYSKKRVDKAGRDIRHGCDEAARKEAILIIQNFREIHLYPLMLIKNHLSRAVKKESKKAIVARRLKRLPTIIDKLERPTLDGNKDNAIKLTRMQDIGGCRAILLNLEQLNNIYDRLKNSSSVHKIIKIDDYLTPKDSGYGGIHLVYSCFDDTDEESNWKKTKIEVQLRTELQHAWATSLEIIDTLEDVKLKTSMEGHEKLRRFFKVAGQLVAHKEKACVLDKRESSELVTELTNLEKELNIRSKLFNYKIAIDVTANNSDLPKSLRSHQGMFLVTLKKNDITHDGGEVTLDVRARAFSPKETEEAFVELASKESDNDFIIAVLVSANEVRNLKKAYPNYFGSTGNFSKFLTETIDSGEKKENKKENKKVNKKAKRKAKRKAMDKVKKKSKRRQR